MRIGSTWHAVGRCILCLMPLAGIGCANSTWSYQAVPNILVDRPENISTEGPLIFRTEPETVVHADAAAVSAGAPVVSRKTVMIVSWRHDLGSYRSSIGRTLVLTLDGPPKLGQYWLNPDNAVLITYSAYSAPMHDRIDINGSIRITKIDTKGITAEVAVKERQEVDSTEFIDRAYDPAYRQFPFHIYGEHTFKIIGPTDPTIDSSAVRMAAQ